MREQQSKKNCQAFMNRLNNSNAYQTIKQLLLTWKRKDNKLDVPAAIDTFMKISKVVHGCDQQQKDQKLIQYFNRCLVKEAIVQKKIITSNVIEDLALQNPRANHVIDNVQQWIKKQSKPSQKTVLKPIAPAQQIKDNLLMSRLEMHPSYRQIVKIIQLYLKSIITFDEIKTLLLPLYSLDPSLITALIQTSQQIIQKRRKATIFASLNQLVDKKYPNLEQVGQSYIIIPQGYANFSKNWKKNDLQYIMNRQYVSVPLGSQVSFIISKKTDYEEQLFLYEDQRYEIDNSLISLKAVIKILSCSIELPQKLQNPLILRTINELYPNQKMGNIFMMNPQLAKSVLLPRVIQKRDQLIACREKFIKVCQQVANKNFYKSLDYRCFYFAKNDKKFNCTARWQKQIQMRKAQITLKHDASQKQQIQDRQSLQRGRYYYVNSFDNITKQNFIQNKQIMQQFDSKLTVKYPAYPDNQILFILNFADQSILNDVLQLILYNCNRKSLLQLFIFKLMRTGIKRQLRKSQVLNHLIETKEKISNSSQISQFLANLKNQNFVNNLQQQGISVQQVLLNQSKIFQKNYKDSQQQFMQMIQQEDQPVTIKDQSSPFQGPEDGYTLIGTKHMYLFLRYVTAIYQRFCKAKEYSEQSPAIFQANQERIDIYKFFLTVMIYKIKDRKYFEQYLRKIFCKNAFIFFTLQKMILSAAKVMNNITIDSLTYQIIKDQTKDYQLGAFDWDKFSFPSVTMQLTRLYTQKQTLFRFTYDPNDKNFYISSWDPPFKQLQNQRSEELIQRMEQYTVAPIKMVKQRPKTKKHIQRVQQIYNAEQISKRQAGKLMLLGEHIIVNRQRDHKPHHGQRNLKLQLNKIKKMKKYL